MVYDMLDGETYEEFIRRIIENDDYIRTVRYAIADGARVKDVLTDDFIEHCISSGLTPRHIQRLTRIGKSSIYDYIMRWKKKNNLYKIYSRSVDITEVIDNTSSGDEVRGTEEIDNVFLLVSDIQAGAMVTARGFDRDPESTVDGYFDKLIENTVKRLNMRNLIVKNMNIIMLGDMVEGWKIFPKQLTIQVRPQIDLIVKNILRLVEFLAGQDHIHKVSIYGVFGNHGRISYLHSTTDNFDQIAYDRIQERIQIYRRLGHGNFHKVESYITDDQIQVRNIGGWNYAYTHGDQIGGLSDGRLQKLFSDIKDVFEDDLENGRVDALLLGHWHCMRWDIYNGKSIIVNGCTYDSPFNKYRITKKADIIQVMFGASDTEAVAWLDRIEVV